MRQDEKSNHFRPLARLIRASRYNAGMRAWLAAACLMTAVSAAAQSPEERLFQAIEDGKPLLAEGIVARGAVGLDARNAEQGTPLLRLI